MRLPDPLCPLKKRCPVCTRRRITMLLFLRLLAVPTMPISTPWMQIPQQQIERWLR